MDDTMQLTDKQIAVLIDFENVGLSRIQWLFDQIYDVGRIIVKRAYADWSVESDKRNQLLELGIEPIHLFRSIKGGKNSSDIRLAIDAADLLYTSPVDTFVIVSSDSDFVPLVSKLRAAGKIVFGAGEQSVAPSTLVKSCDRYFYLTQDRSIRKRDKTAKVSKDKDSIENLIKRAIAASTDERGRVIGSKLHQMMLRLDPSFDYRSYGYSTFTKFLEGFPTLKLIRSNNQGGFTVELLESSPNISTEPQSSKDIWEQVDSSWAKRVIKYGEAIPGHIAASDAAGVLSIAKISTSVYKTLQGLLNASEYLAARWVRKGNTIAKR